MSIFDLFKQNSYLSASKLKEMMEGPNPPMLIDVRTPEEYSGGHIPSSLNVPVQSLANYLSESGVEMDAHIILYCRSGARSSRAKSVLFSIGYENISDFGGINNWNYELER